MAFTSSTVQLRLPHAHTETPNLVRERLSFPSTAPRARGNAYRLVFPTHVGVNCSTRTRKRLTPSPRNRPCRRLLPARNQCPLNGVKGIGGFAPRARKRRREDPRPPARLPRAQERPAEPVEARECGTACLARGNAPTRPRVGPNAPDQPLLSYIRKRGMARSLGAHGNAALEKGFSPGAAPPGIPPRIPRPTRRGTDFAPDGGAVRTRPTRRARTLAPRLGNAADALHSRSGSE